MFDSLFDEPEFYTFDEIANQLLEQGVALSPAEVHGCLVGLLAAGAEHDADAGLHGVNQALGLDLHGELADLLIRLFAATAAALENDDFEFYPLLPDDSLELAQRAQALADWCRGFLAGYARTMAAAGTGGETLPGDSTEALRDFAVIAQASEDEADVSEEESENSYAELVEYLRFAALNVYMDSRARLEDRQRAARGKPDPLH